jgi:type II secretory pathway component PulF
MPFFGTVFAQSSLAHAASILEKLLRAGYPLDEALASAAQSDIRPLFMRLLNRVRDRVRQGASFGEAVNREAGLVPASFRGMVALGESSGRLPNTLGRLAHLYQRRVVKVMHVTASIAFPIGILLAGCCVLMVYSSVFIAVAGIADTIIGNM